MICQAWIDGVSTRKVEQLVRALGNDTGISKSTVSRICAEIDEAVHEFLHRRIDHTWQGLRAHAQQSSDMTERAHHVRVRRPRLREHPQRPLTHLRRILPVHRVPSLLEERNESQADSHTGQDQELADLTANRARLESESDKLLAAHVADAIDLDTLKRHQERIRAGFAEHSEHHTRARAFLHESLRLPADAHLAYARSGDADRRIANQALYTRLDITGDEQLRPTLAEPFATIFREAHQGDDEGKEAKPEHATALDVACSRRTLLVDLRGFEPLTSSLRTKRATNCATGP